MNSKTLIYFFIILFLPFSLQAGEKSSKFIDKVSDLNPFKNENKDKDEKDTAKAVINKFKKTDPSIKSFFKSSSGYAVFPSVGKGGIGIGGAYGKGVVFEKGKEVGAATLTQVSIGFQWGGQVYSEIIFFKDKKNLDDFKTGNFEFGAQVSAVALTEGAGAEANFNNGIAVFTLTKGGLMYQATVGGQKFTYKDKNQ